MRQAAVVIKVWEYYFIVVVESNENASIHIDRRGQLCDGQLGRHVVVQQYHTLISPNFTRLWLWRLVESALITDPFQTLAQSMSHHAVYSSIYQM